MTLASLWGAAIVGWGQAFLSVCRFSIESLSDYVAAFWMGLACVVFGLQILHLVLPINPLAGGLMATLGILLLCLDWSRHWANWRRMAASRLFSSGICIFLLFALWAANRAISGPLLLDSGAYHFPTLRWLATYPAVPGLGNLEGLLAANQAYFLYQAALNSFPLVGWSYHYGNALLIFMGLVLPTKALAEVITGAFDRPPLMIAFHALCLIPYQILIRSMYPACPTPDLLIIVLEIVLCGYFLEFLLCEPTQKSFYFVIIEVLCALGIMAKLSFIVFGPVFFLAATFHLFFSRYGWPEARTLVFTGIFIGCWCTAWVAHGVIQSGYVLFPFTFGAFNVDWRVPSDIPGAYVRTFHTAHTQHVVSSNFNALSAWFRYNSKLHDFCIRYSVAVTSLMALPSILMLFCIRVGRDSLVAGRTLTCLVLGVALWFVTAPIDRFGFALLWLVPILMASSIAAQLRSLTGLRIIVVLFFAAGLLITGIRIRLITGQQPEWPNGIPSPLMATYKTWSGLVVNLPVPNEEDVRKTYIWNQPLPSFLYPNLKLELRGSSLREGFHIGKEPVLDDSIPSAYAKLLQAEKAMQQAMPLEDVISIHEADRRIKEACQVLLEYVRKGTPSPPIPIENLLTNIIITSGDLQTAAHQGDKVKMEDDVKQITKLIGDVPSFYAPNTFDVTGTTVP